MAASRRPSCPRYSNERGSAPSRGHPALRIWRASGISYLLARGVVCCLLSRCQRWLPSPGAWLVFPAASAGVMKGISSAHKPALSYKRENKQTNLEVETGDFCFLCSFRAKILFISHTKDTLGSAVPCGRVAGVTCNRFNCRETNTVHKLLRSNV